MTENRVETLLREAFRAHEDLADPRRARELVTAPPTAVRRWVPALSGAAAVLVVVGAITQVVGHDQPGAVPGTHLTTSSGSPAGGGDATRATDAHNRAMAMAASVRTLARTPVPEGAVRLGGQPDDWPKDYGVSLGPSDGRLTRTAWWSVPLDSEALAEFLGSHEPEGLRHTPGEIAIDCGNSYGICSTTYVPIRSPHPEAYAEPTLLVQFTASGGRSLMRADTFTFARLTRPQESYIAGSVTSVRIDRVIPGSGSGHHNIRVPHVEITDPQQIDRLAAAVNGLYGHFSFSGSCPFPGEPRPSLTLNFTTAAGVVRVQGNRDCWSGLAVTRDGQRVGPELDPDGIDEVIDRVLKQTSSAHR